MKHKRMRTGHDYHIYEFTLDDIADALCVMYEDNDGIQDLFNNKIYEIEYDQSIESIVLKGKTYFEELDETTYEGEPVKKETNVEMVYESIRRGYDTNKLISADTGLTSKQVSNAVYYLIKSNQVKRLKNKELSVKL